MARKTARLTIAGVPISNADKVLYPAAGFTKADAVRYYVAVSRFILPHLKDRPVTLKRYPDGVGRPFFYEKNAPRFTPDWVRIVPVARAHGGPDIRYVVIRDRRTLAWAVGIASLELHPFLHRAPRLTRPTMVVFDLDPGEGANLLTSARVALLVKDVMGGLRLRCFAKVSGSKGVQVYVPLNTPGTYDATRPFVSMPVTWAELEAALAGRDASGLEFSPDAAQARLQKAGDLFEPVLSLKQRLPDDFTAALPRRRAHTTPPRHTSERRATA